ncbi:adaptor complex AP-3 medium subunit, putative [Trypanosoma brucei gambiense DAL972]|uniref:Mu-adaptin 3, putative n=2 Tax=Trypanosoma brucei TaxID=5691 RepID=C9ZM64_TRYB9|nr:adaptor complex AP-3 medium subunit, putative [Trypanosoma brucei gambiense DAL972]RHW72881.1 AP-3 complex subunit mu [Trypanosoma brucei equiperdum]CBH10489.1 adaptor complex AP-3 medium subunit, putative [Trypanosoma brucei gambiense DAL972]|eukprot:XP_011772779.1 adaptor complex AP-3 medium subunit, putative [Trypanosoma brucei gambiense DAL972]
MITGLFFLNKHGEVIIEKEFREKVPRSSLEDFWCTYMTPLRSIEEAPAVITYSRFAFIQIHRNDVVLLAVATSECFPLFVMEVLALAAKVVQKYLKVISESTLRENFSLVYQLLVELIDNGYPLTTEMHVLEELVLPPSLENVFRSALEAPVAIKRRHMGSRAVPWRDPATKHSSNEIFFDIVENLDCIVDCEGNVVQSAVRGAVEVNCRLSGLPEVIMRLTGIDCIEDIAMHRCVRRSRYEVDRMISFIPVDGKFTLLQYRCKMPNSVQVPFYVTPQITFNASVGRFNCMVGFRGSGLAARSREYEIQKLIIHLPLPPQTEAVQVHSISHGNTNFKKARNMLVWNVGSLHRGTCSLSGEFTFGTEREKEGLAPCTGGSALVEFSIPNYLLSSIRVDSVQVLNDLTKPYKGVKYVTTAGRFAVRTI